MLRTIVNAPRYVHNYELRKDLKIGSVTEEIIRFGDKYKTRLDNHLNDLTKELCTDNLPTELHKRYSNDLLPH